MLRGFVNIIKPVGMTSSDVVVKVRGILRAATGEKIKVGHLGTLDPQASGVLPVAVGSATRLFDLMLAKRKTYIASFKFGVTTDTLDCAGKITDTKDVSVSKNDVKRVLDRFIGEIEQLPPQYSAKSVEGQRAYDIARSGGYADLQPKKVSVYSITLPDEGFNFSNIINSESSCAVYNEHSTAVKYCYTDKTVCDENEYFLRIECGSGTYIRALARDIADALGTVGYMTSLVRTASGPFSIENGVTLEQFQTSPLDCIMLVEQCLKDYAQFELPCGVVDKVLNGIRLQFDLPSISPFVVTVDSKAVALGENENGYLKLTTRL